MATNGKRDINILIFGASLRRGSLHDRLAELAGAVVEEKGGTADLAHMSDFDCPSYDGDVEKEDGFPAGAERMREALTAADAMIVASPEYNASMPGVLKNVIDWMSRYRPQPFNAKHALLMSASPSMVGGNRGLWALRVPLEHLGMQVYPNMFSLAQAHEAFAESGRIRDETLQHRFEGTVDCFMEMVEAAKHYPAMKRQWVEFLGERAAEVIDRVESSPAQAA